MPTIILVVLIFGGGLALGVYMLRWQQRKGEALLAAWAVREGLRIVEREPANEFGTGPMNRGAANKQIVYRIRVSDQSGQMRRGTARVGSATLGVLSDEVSVEWDG